MGVVVGTLLALYGFAFMVWPYKVWSATAGMSFETPQLIEPSERQLRYWRVSGSIFMTLGVFLAVTLPGDGNAGDRFERGAWPAAIGSAVTLVLFIRALRSPHVDFIDLPPNEPSLFVYWWWSTVFAVWLGIVAIGLPKLLASPTTNEIAEEWISSGKDRWGDAFAADLPVESDVPAGMLAIPQGEYLAMDSFWGVPEQLPALAESLGPESVAQLESTDLIVLAEPDIVCEITGAVVREVTPQTEADDAERSRVEVALLTHDRGTVEDCISDELDFSRPVQAVFVDLDEPLNSRSVVPHPGAPPCEVKRAIPLHHEIPDAELCATLAWSASQDLYFDDMPRELREDD